MSQRVSPRMGLPWFLTVVLLAGCARTVTIDSVPRGAACYVDGKLLGTTPVTTEMSSARWWGLGRKVRVELPGFRTVHGPLDWEYDPKHLVFMIGVVFWPTQIVHAHPRAHRRLKRYYRVILDERVDPAGPSAERRIIYGSNQLPDNLRPPEVGAEP